VVAGRRIYVRQLHDPLAHPRLIVAFSSEVEDRLASRKRVEQEMSPGNRLLA
jgi:hypothetical protein